MRASTMLTGMVASTTKRGNRSSQQRQLRMESLEPRWVFSAAPIAGAECIPVAEPAPAEGELVASLPSSIGPAFPVVPNFSTQLPPAPQPLTTSIVFEQAFAEYADGAEGEDVFHITLSGSSNFNGSWTFSGMVGTLAGHSGAHVQFGGLLAGHTASLNQYGQFNYTHNFGFGVLGSVTGKGVDSAGNVTNIETVYVTT